MSTPLAEAAGRTAATPAAPEPRAPEQLPELTEVAISATIVAGLLDALPDGVLMIDETGQMLLVNTRIEELFGYTRGELLGQPVEMLLPEADRAAHVAHRSSYLAAPQIRPMAAGMSLRGRRRNGGEFPVEISLSPVTANGPWVVATVRDDDSRQHLEEHRRNAAVSAELTRISEGLADTVIRGLFGTGLQLQGGLSRPAPFHRAVIEQAIEHIDQTIRDVRETIFDLRAGRPADEAEQPNDADR